MTKRLMTVILCLLLCLLPFSGMVLAADVGFELSSPPTIVEM